ncbi:MAG TPA: DNA alkylation repair protein [Albitalea sp.]|nr:DNA alkylation repair protein [Albitalea sp.]
MATLDDTLRLLHEHARPGELQGMARFGMAVDKRLGVSVPNLRRLAKALGRDHALAQALWDTGIPDAQILAGMLAEPARFTSRQMDAWARSMNSWDVCDGACLNAFAHSPLAWNKVAAWAHRHDEFTRRAAFSLLATLAVHDKASPDSRFEEALALVEGAAGDERNFVKKAVNWALRSIGKRSAALHRAALACAARLQATDSRAARWIAADALRELRSDAVQTRLAPWATASAR